MVALCCPKFFPRRKSFILFGCSFFRLSKTFQLLSCEKSSTKIISNSMEIVSKVEIIRCANSGKDRSLLKTGMITEYSIFMSQRLSLRPKQFQNLLSILMQAKVKKLWCLPHLPVRQILMDIARRVYPLIPYLPFSRLRPKAGFLPLRQELRCCVFFVARFQLPMFCCNY